jgi:hypothetical protein
MNKQDTTPSQNLRVLCEHAGILAAGGGKASRSEATTDSTARLAGMSGKPLRRRMLIGGVGLLALVGVGAQLRHDGAAPATPAATAAVAAAAVAQQPAPGFTEPESQVLWRAGELVVTFDEVPLPQAVALLAQATRTSVSGMALLRKPVSVTLHRRFADLGLAWQALLAGHAGFSIACGAGHCQVAITGETASSVPPPRAGIADPATDGAAAPTGPGAEERLSQPDGAC